MNETVKIASPIEGLGLRFQAPSITVGTEHAVADVMSSDAGIVWNAQAGEVQLEARLTEGDTANWCLRMVLHNSGTVGAEVRVGWPYLFYHFETTDPVRVFDPTFGGILEARTIPIVTDYPGPATFCLTAAAGSAATLAIGLLNPEQRHVEIRHIPAGQDGQIRFICPRVWVDPGQSVELPEQFIRIGADWGDAFTPYREFAQAAFPRRRERPDWLTEGNFTEARKAHCLVPFQPPEAIAGVWIFDNEGCPRTLEEIKQEIDEAFADGAANGYTPLFYQFGWWQSMADIRGLFMFDSVCGDYDRAHDLTKPVIDYIHSRGARTYLYTNAISAGDETDVFARQPELFVRDGAGAHIRNANYPMYLFCPGAPGLREYWEKVLQTILIDLDADGIFLDQIGGGTSPAYCDAPGHRHAHPDTYGADMVALVDWIATRARQLKSDCYIGGELVLDSRSPLLDETHGCGYVKITSTDIRSEIKPPEYYAFVRHLTPQIFSSVGTLTNMMQGAIGSHAWPQWRQHRAVLESELTPCETTPVGALAYLFGPVGGEVVLAVQAAKENTSVNVRLPILFEVEGTREGCVEIFAGSEPVFHRFTLL